MRARAAGFIGAVLLTVAVVLSLRSTDRPVRAAEGAAREQVLVTTSGRILSGKMTRNAGGWLVEQPNGRVQVPEDQVKLVADSLVDAYRKQRDAVAEPTPATHVMLAQWCVSYRLHDEARDELKKCLTLDPDHTEARRLLRRIDDTLTPKPSALPAAATVLKTADGFVVPEVESLGGLSRETATTFTARVQPLLMNKCGNSACHGAASSSGFRLSAVRVGANGHRMHTERNLAEVLRLVDIHEPGLSPLLAVPQGRHGGATAIFSGPTGNEQLKSLRSFVKLVSQEKLKEEQELAARPSVVQKKKASASMTGVPVETTRPEAPSSATTQAAAARPTPENDAPRSNRDSRPAGRAEAPDAEAPSDDAFDPQQFNRRFHGTTSKPGPAASGSK